MPHVLISEGHVLIARRTRPYDQKDTCLLPEGRVLIESARVAFPKSYHDESRDEVSFFLR